MNNLYIASTSRSGSTLLAEYLCQLPNIVSLGELMYWSIDNYNDIICTCGNKNCQYLKQLGINIDTKDTDLILYYWQEYEKHLFGDYKNLELYRKDTKNREKKLEIAYLNILKVYQRIFGLNNIFIDNSKNINIFRDLLELNIGIFKGVILTRSPLGILSSYVKSGIRKNVVRDLQSKINEIKYFLKQSKNLIEKYGDQLIHIKYEDFIKNSVNIGYVILDFIDCNRIHINGILENTFLRKSHLVKGNHFMYDSNKYIKIFGEKIDVTLISEDFMKIIQEDQELQDLLLYFGY